MPIDRHAKLIFVHIPKTAGTSVELALSLHGDWRIENQSNFFGQISSNSLLAKNLSSNFMQHLRLYEIHDLLGEEFFDYEIFTVVRNPWTRFLSSFRRKDPDLCSYVRWRARHDAENASLSDYVKMAKWVRHPHLNSQASFFSSTGPGKPVKNILKKVRVFKFEDLPLLENWLSLKYKKEIRFCRHQAAVSPLPVIQRDELLPLCKEIYKLYRRDCRLFGYNFETPVDL
jgi:hypothetical protein